MITPWRARTIAGRKASREIDESAAVQLDLRGVAFGILIDEVAVQADACVC